ncbi:MAG: hypothetical protein RR058_07035 [Oscillospiraceae bacterium]
MNDTNPDKKVFRADGSALSDKQTRSGADNGDAARLTASEQAKADTYAAKIKQNLGGKDFADDVPAPAAPRSKKAPKPGKAKHSRAPLIIALVLVIAVAASGLFVHFSGLLYTMLPQSNNTYNITSKEELVAYLQHPSLQSGDTLNVADPYELDVATDFGGYLSFPLVNFAGDGHIDFNGGTILIRGGNSGSVKMNGVAFHDCALYIDAPNASVEWDNVTNDDTVNIKSLNGTSHPAKITAKFTGSKFTLPVTLTNVSDTALGETVVKLISPGLLFCDSGEYTIPSLDSGASVAIEVPVIATCGGRLNVTAVANGADGKQVISGASEYVSVIGPGYYSGDLHTHSEVSEAGRTGTVSMNIERAYETGMSYILSVESDGKDAQKYSPEQVEAVTGGKNDFIQLNGGETGSKSRHLLILNSDARPKDNYGEIVWDFGTYLYQDAINEVVKDGGQVILPHFFGGGRSYSESIAIARSAYDVAAIEVFDNTVEYMSMEYKVGINVCDNVNYKGDKHLFWLATSNNVTSNDIGTRYTKSFMPMLSETNVYDMLKTGNYFLTNGPELSFTVGGAPMGGTVLGKADEKIAAHIYCSDDSPLTSVIVYKFDITGSVDKVSQSTVYEKDLTGQGIYTLDETVEFTLDKDCYYRIEVLSEKANVKNEVGVALSNPIFASIDDKSGDASVHSLSYGSFGASLEKSENGTYFINSKMAVNPGFLNASVADNAKTSIVYHKNGSDNFADYITVRVLAENKAQRIMTVYVVD